MVNIIIDGKKLQVRDDVTILQAARENGFSIPTLCYLEGLNEIGACRLCLVEVKGQHRLVSSCNTKVREGMEISTRSAKVRMARRLNVELILSQHNCNCPSCPRILPQKRQLPVAESCGTAGRKRGNLSQKIPSGYLGQCVPAEPR